jgi:hypothetical protein
VSDFLLTATFTQHNTVKWVKHFFGVKEINAARKRLERLLQEEDRAVGSQTLKAAEGQRTHAACNSPCIEFLSKHLPPVYKEFSVRLTVFLCDNVLVFVSD